MQDRVTILVAGVLLVFATLACNAFAGQPDNLLPVPPALTPAQDDPDATGNPAGVAPTATLPPDATIPLNGPLVQILVDLNVRGGPGVQFPRVGFLLGGDTVTAIGRDPASGWWQIQCSPEIDASECWVSGGAQYTRLLGELPTPAP